jgi:hypothetical protein
MDGCPADLCDLEVFLRGQTRCYYHRCQDLIPGGEFQVIGNAENVRLTSAGGPHVTPNVSLCPLGSISEG